MRRPFTTKEPRARADPTKKLRPNSHEPTIPAVAEIASQITA